ncbi:3,4-dioxygenase subunit beta [Virgisporangium aliadipatigenens]|uniref:3,4-dioxygenase subunit beta n=1 Tax=Virgisporangium aliadipatigenens TaxID=741659 RepID=A0A8J3YPT7_9ACTN|nr:3,4-dioxygenase subunit beta [Virgisporangium aliadipatigenens]GIJ48362.1 3,4-dioxygenase subunit beta [Virgisporangium aliadipatigenens]
MGPRYEGRPLPRPDAEPVDQGLAFDLGTLVDRRRVLRMFGLGVAVAGLAACTDDPSAGGSSSGGSTSAAGEIPEETAGPYPGDGSNGPDVLERSGIIRGDIRSSFDGAPGTAEGVLLTLELSIVDMAGGKPFDGTAVYVWHCDREGRYSMYSDGVRDRNYLRGVQVADTAGKVSFTSVFPGCYTGRWPHVHFEVYPDAASITDATRAIATSQVALPKEACDAVYARPGYERSGPALARVSLGGDGVFGDDGGAAQLGTATGDVGGGYTVALTVNVDTRTAPGRG